MKNIEEKKKRLNVGDWFVSTNADEARILKRRSLLVCRDKHHLIMTKVFIATNVKIEICIQLKKARRL